MGTVYIAIFLLITLKLGETIYVALPEVQQIIDHVQILTPV